MSDSLTSHPKRQLDLERRFETPPSLDEPVSQDKKTRANVPMLSDTSWVRRNQTTIPKEEDNPFPTQTQTLTKELFCHRAVVSLCYSKLLQYQVFETSRYSSFIYIPSQLTNFRASRNVLRSAFECWCVVAVVENSTHARRTPTADLFGFFTACCFRFVRELRRYIFFYFPEM